MKDRINLSRSSYEEWKKAGSSDCIYSVLAAFELYKTFSTQDHIFMGYFDLRLIHSLDHNLPDLYKPDQPWYNKLRQ